MKIQQWTSQKLLNGMFSLHRLFLHRESPMYCLQQTRSTSYRVKIILLLYVSLSIGTRTRGYSMTQDNTLPGMNSEAIILQTRGYTQRKRRLQNGTISSRYFHRHVARCLRSPRRRETKSTLELVRGVVPSCALCGICNRHQLCALV